LGPTVLLAAGLGLSAAAGSGFLAIVNHSGLSAAGIHPLTGLYLLLAAIGTGMFAGFEQEMTRAVSRAHALGHDEATVIRHQVRNAAFVLAGTLAAVCAAAPFMVHKWMVGDWVVFLELLLGLTGCWAAFLIRGVLTGRRQFRSYAISMVVEGLSRLLPGVLLVLVGFDATWSFGLVFAMGFVIAALSGLVVARAPVTDGTPAPPDAAEQEPASANQEAVRLARLTGGIMAGQVIMYATPLFINAQVTPQLVVSVTAAVGLTRLALLVLFPMQAPLLPKLTAAAARREMHVVRVSMAKLVAACVVAGAFGVAVVGAIGPWIVRVIMGGRAPLSRVFLMELAAATLLLLVGNALQSALIALNRQRTALWGWVIGVVVLFALFLLPFGALTTGAVAAMGGPLVTVLIFGRDVLRSTRGAEPGRARSAPVRAAAPAVDGERVPPR
jgi:O-antigen/teichoic acid export membrane protein